MGHIWDIYGTSYSLPNLSYSFGHKGIKGIGIATQGIE